jgi:hypothetical protein
MRPHKFQTGTGIRNIGDLADWLTVDGWVYWGTRPKHPAFIWGMTLRTLVEALKAGKVARAIPNDPPA